MSTMALSVTDRVATFTDDHGRVFTATDVTVEPGDVTSVEIAGLGPWFVVQRDGVEVHRYPLRHGDDLRYTEMWAMLTWPNPFLPPTDTEGGTP
jgi:hypothetical protein